ncbi:MAG TPA: hypothetical protein VNT79_04340 [Phycisphaerae bacterium]|nr:hypothetical protein [Phycisphaerae bacterium]
MTLELSTIEQDVLSELLAEELPRLSVEIHRTENRDFRRQLEEKDRTLRQLQTRLGGTPAVV